MRICNNAYLQIRIIANMHYYNPDSSGSWPRQNLHPGPLRLANTHYFHEYALLSVFYESLKTDSLLWSLTLRTVTEENSSLDKLGNYLYVKWFKFSPSDFWGSSILSYFLTKLSITFKLLFNQLQNIWYIESCKKIYVAHQYFESIFVLSVNEMILYIMVKCINMQLEDQVNIIRSIHSTLR